MVFQLYKVSFCLMGFHENASDGFQSKCCFMFHSTFPYPNIPFEYLAWVFSYLLVMILMISECWWNGLKMASDTAAVTLDTIWPLHTHNESKYFPYPVKISLLSPIMRTIWLIAVVFTVFSFSAFLHPWHGDIIKLQGDLQ